MKNKNSSQIKSELQKTINCSKTQGDVTTVKEKGIVEKYE